MIRFLVQRLFLIPATVLFGNLIGFAFAFYIGPQQATRNPYSYGAINISNFWQEYWDYLSRAVLLDFGNMPNNSTTKILDLIIQSSVASLGLFSLAVFLSVVLGVGIGIIGVRLNPPRKAWWMIALTTIGQASPGFFIGVLLIFLSIQYVIWGSSLKPLIPFQGFGWDTHLILPTITLIFLPTIKIANVTTGLLSDEMKKQYVIAARSFGFSPNALRFHVAFRNILAPVVIVIFGSIRFMAAELIIVERLFNWPGLGRLFANVLVVTSGTDYLLYPPLFATLLAMMIGFFLVTDVLTGVLVRIFDPRLRD